MPRMRRSPFIGFFAGLLLLLLSWGMEVNPALGYAPVDDLITQVDQLRQSGEIFDVTVASNLIVSLQVVGTTIDAGDRITARELLTAFAQEVGSVSGVLMTPSAADQLISKAIGIAGIL